MVYKACAHYSRAACHWIIDHSIPMTAEIALASGAASGYVWYFGLAHLPGETNRWVEAGTCNDVVRFFIGDGCKTVARFVTIPMITPWAVPKMSHSWSVGTGLATSFILNVIVEVFFGVKHSPKKAPPSITDTASQTQSEALIENKQPRDTTPPPMIELALGQYLKDLAPKPLQEPANTTDVIDKKEMAASASTQRKPVAAKFKIKPQQQMAYDCPWKFCQLPLKA